MRAHCEPIQRAMRRREDHDGVKMRGFIHLWPCDHVDLVPAATHIP
jgi:hypothetical protein